MFLAVHLFTDIECLCAEPDSLSVVAQVVIIVCEVGEGKGIVRMFILYPFVWTAKLVI